VRDLARNRVDVIWKLSDTTVARASKTLFESCASLRMPVIGDAEAQLAQGAIAVAFLDFRAAGERAARLARCALDAKHDETPQWERFDEPRVLRNEARMRELGISLR